MKIKAIIIDRVPKTCMPCVILRNGTCVATGENVVSVCTTGRGKYCLLITDKENEKRMLSQWSEYADVEDDDGDHPDDDDNWAVTHGYA